MREWLTRKNNNRFSNDIPIIQYVSIGLDQQLCVFEHAIFHYNVHARFRDKGHINYQLFYFSEAINIKSFKIAICMHVLEYHI